MASYKKKTMRLGEMLDAGLVKQDEMLRYKNKQNELLAVGFADKRGIWVPSTKSHYSFTAFEDLTSSHYHRPCQYTFADSSISLQSLVNGKPAEIEGDLSKSLQTWGITKQKQPIETFQIVEDPHDKHCKICWQEGDLLHCKICSTSIHATCLRLVSQIAPEDWQCPKCCCAITGKQIPHELEVVANLDQVQFLEVSGNLSGPVIWSGADLGLPLATVKLSSKLYDKKWPELAPRIQPNILAKEPPTQIEEEKGLEEQLPSSLDDQELISKANRVPTSLVQKAHELDASSSELLRENIETEIPKTQLTEDGNERNTLESLERHKEAQPKIRHKDLPTMTQTLDKEVELVPLENPSFQNEDSRSPYPEIKAGEDRQGSTKDPNHEGISGKGTQIRKKAKGHIINVGIEVAGNGQRYPSMPDFSESLISDPLQKENETIVPEENNDMDADLVQDLEEGKAAQEIQPNLSSKRTVNTMQRASRELQALLEASTDFAGREHRRGLSKTRSSKNKNLEAKSNAKKTENVGDKLDAQVEMRKNEDSVSGWEIEPTPNANTRSTKRKLEAMTPKSVGRKSNVLLPNQDLKAIEKDVTEKAKALIKQIEKESRQNSKKAQESRKRAEKRIPQVDGAGDEFEGNKGQANGDEKGSALNGGHIEEANQQTNGVQNPELPLTKILEASERPNQAQAQNASDQSRQKKSPPKTQASGRIDPSRPLDPPKGPSITEIDYNQPFRQKHLPANSPQHFAYFRPKSWRLGGSPHSRIPGDQVLPRQNPNYGPVNPGNPFSETMKLFNSQTGGKMLSSNYPQSQMVHPSWLGSNDPQNPGYSLLAQPKQIAIPQAQPVRFFRPLPREMYQAQQIIPQQIIPAPVYAQPMAQIQANTGIYPHPQLLPQVPVPIQAQPLIVNPAQVVPDGNELIDLDNTPEFDNFVGNYVPVSTGQLLTQNPTMYNQEVPGDTFHAYLESEFGSEEPLSLPLRGEQNLAQKAAMMEKRLGTNEGVSSFNDQDLEDLKDLPLPEIQRSVNTRERSEKLEDLDLERPKKKSRRRKPLLLEEDASSKRRAKKDTIQKEPEKEIFTAELKVTQDDILDENAEIAVPILPASDDDVHVTIFSSQEKPSTDSHSQDPILPESESQMGTGNVSDLSHEESARASNIVDENLSILGQELLQANTPEGDKQVFCMATGIRVLLSSLPPSKRSSVENNQPWYSTLACEESSKLMVRICGQGLMQCTPTIHPQKLHWQLIQGSSVTSKDQRGYSLNLSEDSRQSLQASLVACRHILAECVVQFPESRSGQDLIPGMLMGAIQSGTKERHGTKDLSGFFTAILWAGSSIASLALVRPFGNLVAEIPVVCTRPELQRQGFATMLMRHLEASLLRCGVESAIMPGASVYNLQAPDSELQNKSAEPVSEILANPIENLENSVTPLQGNERAYWGSQLGYNVANESTMQGLIKLPIFTYGPAPILHKKLGQDKLPKVKVPEVEAILEVAEMKVSEPQQYLKSGYLKPINVLNI